MDVTAYDVAQCFDSLWLKDCINDLHDSGIKDDRLALVYESNRNNKISVNVPSVGETEPIDISEVVMQGSSWGSIMCGNSVGDIGGDTMNRAKNNDVTNFIYKYKDEVDVSSLEMVDDVLGVAECGIKSVLLNAYINAKFELKRLRLNKKKCFQIHAIKKNNSCPDLIVHEDIICLLYTSPRPRDS